jgi:hypothetical protein
MTEKDEEKTPRIGDVATFVYDGAVWKSIEPTKSTTTGAGIVTMTVPHTSGTYTYPGTTFASPPMPPLYFPKLHENDEIIVIDGELPSREQFVTKALMNHRYVAPWNCMCELTFPHDAPRAAEEYFAHLAKVSLESADEWDELINLGTDDDDDDEDMHSL